MKNFYKYGFWIIIFLCLFMLTIWRISVVRLKSKTEHLNEKSRNRINSLMISNLITQRNLNNFAGTDIISDELNSDVLDDTTIVILLSDIGCNDCQKKELLRLNKLQKRIRLRNINIIGITIMSEKTKVALLKKITKVELPIYCVEDSTFFNHLSLYDEFPQVLYIADSIILSAFNLVPNDDDFSIEFYDKLVSLIITQ